MCWLSRAARGIVPSCSPAGETSPSTTTTTTTEHKAMPARRSRRRGRAQPQPQGRAARRGDVVTLDFTLTPDDGYVPNSLFDASGTAVSVVLGWGNYLPGLHDLVEGMRPGDSIKGASVDAGWGRKDPALIAEISKAKLRGSGHDALKVGDELKLAGGAIRAIVVRETDAAFVVDANPPLAGSTYSCNLRVLSVSAPPETQVCERNDEAKEESVVVVDDDEDAPAQLVETSDEEDEDSDKEADESCELEAESSAYEGSTSFRVASFAVGCFWGGELAFLREPGVAGTRVGYTQGSSRCPTYQEVCEGSAGHRESVLVVYDPALVSYERLMVIALERIHVNATSSGGGDAMQNLFAEPDEAESAQYRHEIYFHSTEQRRAAERFLKNNGRENGHEAIEVLPAATFHSAEERHQQYLLKGGQSARKGSKETIRCFG